MNVRFDEQAVRKILTDYHQLLGVGIGLYDSDYKPLFLQPTSYEHGFCQLVRHEPSVYEACQRCDENAFKIAYKKRDIHVYKCHLGLFEAVAPIIDEDMVIGYVMIGQILDSTATSIQWRKIYQQCMDHYGLDVSLYKEAFYDLKAFPLSEIKAMTNILMACASYIWYRKMAHIERGGLFERASTYMKDHMSDTLTIDDLCAYLKVSRTTLYNCISDHTSKGFTQYYRHIRLEASKILLTTTDMKVRDIASNVGYSDYNYFSRLFKRTYAISPRAYRVKK